MGVSDSVKILRFFFRDSVDILRRVVLVLEKINHIIRIVGTKRKFDHRIKLKVIVLSLYTVLTL